MNMEKIIELTFRKENDCSQNDCPDMETICAFTDDSLSLNDRRNIEKHVMNCSNCFDLHLSILQGIKDTNESEIPLWLTEKALEKYPFAGKPLFLNIKNWIRNLIKSWSWFSWGGGVFAGAYVVLLILAFFNPMNSGIINDTGKLKFEPSEQTVPDTSYVSTDVSRMDSADAHYIRGENLIKSSSIEKAKIEFNQAIKCNSDDANAHWQLAIIYENQGNYEQAIKHWKRYMALCPKVGSYDEAKKHLEKLDSR